MTAKEFVKSHYPTARSEKHTIGKIKGFTNKYFLIRIENETMYFAEAWTESKAWKNAKDRIMEENGTN